jgi:dTDP-4-amino-4,6-dideoxygalactose transaminase
MRIVPFNRAFTTGSELRYISDAIRSTQLSGNGPFSAKCEDWLERRTGAQRALMTHSCTGALEMAAILAEIGPGDEVIMPSFSFVSTANAVVARGAVPVFVDIRGDTLNLDEALVEGALTPRTKALMVVHYAGVACEMDALNQIAREHGLTVIEDAAQGVAATYNGRPLGAIGDIGALSFHETKNVMCGEGGALLINRDEWIRRGEVVHEKGTDRTSFFRGDVDKYTWQDVGSSFALSDLSAAFLWAQLEEADAITQRRREIWNAYHDGLKGLEEREVLRRPIVPEGCEHNAHLYYLLLPQGSDRAVILASLNEAGVNAVFHFVPLHSSPAGLRFGRHFEKLDVTESVSGRLVRLPLWAGMEEADIGYVVETIERVILRDSRSQSRCGVR